MSLFRQNRNRPLTGGSSHAQQFEGSFIIPNGIGSRGHPK
jgi:hypothetical protein